MSAKLDVHKVMCIAFSQNRPGESPSWPFVGLGRRVLYSRSRSEREGQGLKTPSARDFIAVEREFPAPGKEKARVVRDRLGISLTRYSQLLGRQLDDPGSELMRLDPVLTFRLISVRDARRERRSSRPLTAAARNPRQQGLDLK
jgi:hypothetical protein